MTDILDMNKHKHSDKFMENLANKDWLGYVVDATDELNMGRCKIRIFEKFDELKDDELPWAFPAMSTVFAGGKSKGCGSFSYPKKDTLVRVRFQNGDLYSPEYYIVQNLNDKMKSEVATSYENCQVLLYDEDEDVKIIYTKAKGLVIWHKKSHMTIDAATHITVEHAGSTSIMTYIDGDIKIKSNTTITSESKDISEKADSNIKEEAGTKIYSKAPMVHIDSPMTQLGPSGHVPAVRCPELISLLMTLAAIIDSSKIVMSPAATSAVSSMSAALCSTTVFVAT